MYWVRDKDLQPAHRPVTDTVRIVPQQNVFVLVFLLYLRHATRPLLPVDGSTGKFKIFDEMVEFTKSSEYWIVVTIT